MEQMIELLINMVNLGGTFVLATMTIYYLTMVLVIGENGGPFESDHDTVVIQVGSPSGMYQATYRVGLWDRIRRLFRVYDIERTPQGDKWKLRVSAARMWLCPMCLSFWVGIPVYAVVAFLLWNPMVFLMIFASSGVVTHLANIDNE